MPSADTIAGFREILDGKHDDKPESAFYMKGDISEVKEDGKEVKPEVKKEEAKVDGKK